MKNMYPVEHLINLFNLKFDSINSHFNGTLLDGEIEQYLSDAQQEILTNSLLRTKDQSVKDILSPLVKRTDIQLYKTSKSDEYLGIVPNDYRAYISSRIESSHMKCGNEITSTPATTSIRYTSIKLGDWIDFSLFDVQLVSDSSSIFNSFSRATFTGPEHILFFIEALLANVNPTKNVLVYWQQVNDLFLKDSLIIVGNPNTRYTNNGSSFTNLTYTTKQSSIEADFPDEAQVSSHSTITPKDDVIEFYRNSDMYNSSYREPILRFIQNGFLVYKDENDFYPNTLKLVYYKEPRPISSANNQTLEINTNVNNIIDIAVRKATASIYRDLNAKIQENINTLNK